MEKFIIYIIRTDSNERFLIHSKKKQFETTDEEEAKLFFEKQTSLLYSLLQSGKHEGKITLYMDVKTVIGGRVFCESNMKSISIPLTLYSKLSLEQS